MKKAIIAFIAGLFLGALVSGTIVYKRTYVPLPEIVHDTLQVILKETQVKLDTIYLKRTQLKYVYLQKDSVIRNQSSSDDWEYYNNFLRSRFPDNSDSIKAN